jgi:phosphatidylserine/phosphatidylglycerophosphate/cardiolipin synthase-like enzyme
MNAPVLVIDADSVRKQLLIQMIRPQSKIMIVTPFLQDVELETGRTLAKLLEAQIRTSTEVELFTTPPSGKTGEFLRKYQLLEAFSALGLKIYVNYKLHSKVFCFNNNGQLFISLIGSTNLTTAALKQRLELAVFSARDQVYHSTMALVRKHLRDGDTYEYLSWKQRNASMIKTTLKGAI